MGGVLDRRWHGPAALKPALEKALDNEVDSRNVSLGGLPFGCASTAPRVAVTNGVEKDASLAKGFGVKIMREEK
jgi:hypothetical protein